MTIYSHLQGGLGNQMFQYAIAKSLSMHHGVNFALDCSWFKKPALRVTPRTLELPLLQITADLTQIARGNVIQHNKLLLTIKYFLPFGPIIKKQINAFKFNIELFNLKDLNRRNLYLFGYWQSYKYFESIRPTLQMEFQTVKKISSHYEYFLRDIRQTESVMLHIRRGDYIHSPSTAKHHGALGLNYYLEAIDSILRLKPNAHFFIFSDDLLWAKEHLPKDVRIIFVENSLKIDDAAQELQLMRACKNHIVANSSLSWWGAWLRNEPGGLVFAPNRWVNNKRLNLDDLLPENWRRIAV
jgi:hypothetical protein